MKFLFKRAWIPIIDNRKINKSLNKLWNHQFCLHYWALVRNAVVVMKINVLKLGKIRCGHREGGLIARSKNFKTPFFKRYWKILLRDTPIGPEPHHFFSFWNISTNMVARGIQRLHTFDNFVQLESIGYNKFLVFWL